MLWVLMLALPFPFIANTAGWITAEVGRQPWLIYGLMRTQRRRFATGLRGQRWFTLLGFLGMYTFSASCFLFLVYREIERGPEPRNHSCEAERCSHRRAERGVSMGTIWFCLVAVMLAGYVVLDGFDLGVGILHLWIARDRRRTPQPYCAPSAPCGTATKCGCSPRAALSTLRFPRSTPRDSAAFICR